MTCDCASQFHIPETPLNFFMQPLSLLGGPLNMLQKCTLDSGAQTHLWYKMGFLNFLFI